MPNIVSKHGTRRLVKGKKFLLFQENHGGHGGWKTSERCPYADRQGLEYLVSLYNSWTPDHKHANTDNVLHQETQNNDTL